MKINLLIPAIIGAFFCAIVWMALPMSVFEENNPTTSLVLKIAGTAVGAWAVYIIFKAIKQ